MTSAQIAIAGSSGVRALGSSPIGPMTRDRDASSTPASRSRVNVAALAGLVHHHHDGQHAREPRRTPHADAPAVARVPVASAETPGSDRRSQAARLHHDATLSVTDRPMQCSFSTPHGRQRPRQRPRSVEGPDRVCKRGTALGRLSVKVAPRWCSSNRGSDEKSS
jgi:hypothetical protein